MRIAKTATLWALCGAASLFGSSFLPLQTGNAWTYRESKTGQQFTVRVGTPVWTKEQTYYALSGYAGKTLLVRSTDQNTIVYLDEDAGREAILISFEPFDHGWWVAPART